MGKRDLDASAAEDLVHDVFVSLPALMRRFRAQSSLRAFLLEQRAALVLCEIEECSAAEVADILGIPEATVRTRCFHARKRLHEQLQRSER